MRGPAAGRASRSGGERSGEEKDAPKEPGGGEFPILGEAPGTYVREPA